MDDLSQRDFSRVPEEELTPDERRELTRRFDDFLDILRDKAGMKPRAKTKPKPKRVMRWNPAALSRKH